MHLVQRKTSYTYLPLDVNRSVAVLHRGVRLRAALDDILAIGTTTKYHNQ